MATTNARLYCSVNEDGSAQNPTAGVQMALAKPDGTMHTSFGAATQDSGVGDGAYYREFTLDDASDPEGVYTLFFKTTTDGGRTPLGCFPVMVKL